MFSSSDPLLYFVTPDIGENLSQWLFLIQEAVEGGARLIQIRDKRGPSETIIQAAKTIQPFLKRRNIPLLINDSVEIARAVDADGVHLGQSDLSISTARAVLGNAKIIGLSVETRQQAMEASQVHVNYIAASPTFLTTTKLDCSPPWGLEGIKKLCAISPHPVIAIGGIDRRNAKRVVECGVAGIAVVSAIAKDLSPRQAAQEIVKEMKKYADARLG